MPKTPPGATRARIRDFVLARVLEGTPPSVREVQDAFGFRSTATVREHLDALVAGGELEQESGRDRGYRLPGGFQPGLVPILGRVHAGALHEAVAHAEGFVAVEARRAPRCFALRVVGESMAGREIHDGDVVLVERDAPVRDGDIVVALIGDEATIKTLRRVGRRIVLAAANPAYADIEPAADGAEFRILGRVVEVRRAL